MTSTVLIRHRVADFDAWHEVYSDHAPVRSAHGLSGEQVLRDLDDPNMVTIIASASDVDQAQAFFADPGLKEAMGRAGVVSAPDLWLTSNA